MQSWSQLVSRFIVRRKKRQASIPDASYPGGSATAPTITATTTTACSSTTDLSTQRYQQQQQKEEDRNEPEQPLQPSSPPSLPSSQEVKVDVETLEFPESRDLALTLGDEWNKDDNMVLPSIDHFLPPPVPTTDANRVLRKKQTRARLSLYRPKSTLHLLRGVKSIPQIVS